MNGGGRAGTRRAVATAALLAALAVGLPVVAHATFATGPGASHTLATGSLSPPSNPALARGSCTAFASDAIVVSWTATPSTWADGHEVLRSTTSGGPYSVVATVGSATTSWTNTGLAFNTTYHYVVRATKGAWRSATTTQVSMTTRSSVCV